MILSTPASISEENNWLVILQSSASDIHAETASASSETQIPQKTPNS